MNTTTIHCSICGYQHIDGKPVMVAGTYCDAVQATEAITIDQWLDSLDPVKAGETVTTYTDSATGETVTVSKDVYFAQPVDANGLPILKYEGAGFTEYLRDTEIDYVSESDEWDKIARWVDKNPTEGASALDVAMFESQHQAYRDLFDAESHLYYLRKQAGTTAQDLELAEARVSELSEIYESFESLYEISAPSHDQMLRVLKRTELPQTFERDERSVVLDGSDGFIATNVYDPEITERFAFKLLNAYRNKQGTMSIGNTHINFLQGGKVAKAFCSTCKNSLVIDSKALHKESNDAGLAAVDAMEQEQLIKNANAFVELSDKIASIRANKAPAFVKERAVAQARSNYRMLSTIVEAEDRRDEYRTAYMKHMLSELRQFVYRVIAHGNNHGPEWLTSRPDHYVLNPLEDQASHEARLDQIAAALAAQFAEERKLLAELR